MISEKGGARTMKRILSLILAVGIVLSLCGMMSAEEYGNPDDFLNAMALGIANRLAAVDDTIARNDDETREYYTLLISKELEQIEVFEQVPFADSQFNLLAHQYIQACQMQRTAAVNYRKPALRAMWGEASSVRNCLIVYLYENYNLPISSDLYAHYSIPGTLPSASASSKKDPTDTRPAWEIALESAAKTLETAKPSPASDFKYINNGKSVRINGYCGEGGLVVIPEEIDGYPVTAIADRAFLDDQGITGLILPKTLKELGGQLPSTLTGTLVIPKGVKKLSFMAFANSKLDGLVILGNCKGEIEGMSSLSNMYSLKFLYIKEGCYPKFPSVGELSYCYDLEVAIIPESVTQWNPDYKACNKVVVYTPAGSTADVNARRKYIETNNTDYEEMRDRFAAVFG